MPAYHGDHAVLKKTAQDAMGVHGELEGYLSSWMGVRDEFAVAVQSAGTGRAIQDTMDSAYRSGVELARVLQDIIDTLKSTDVTIETADLDAASKVHQAVALGTNNVVDTSF